MAALPSLVRLRVPEPARGAPPLEPTSIGEVITPNDTMEAAEEKSCEICLMPLGEPWTWAVVCDNRHAIHHTCVREWVRSKRRDAPNADVPCPVCREPLAAAFQGGAAAAAVDPEEVARLREANEELYDRLDECHTRHDAQALLALRHRQGREECARDLRRSEQELQQKSRALAFATRPRDNEPRENDRFRDQRRRNRGQAAQEIPLSWRTRHVWGRPRPWQGPGPQPEAMDLEDWRGYRLDMSDSEDEQQEAHRQRAVGASSHGAVHGSGSDSIDTPAD